MRATINNTLVAQLKPTGKAFDVCDTKLRGFLIRVNPSGSMTYVCQYKRGRRFSIGRVGVLTPAQARDRAREILGDATKGIDPNEVKREKNKQITLRKFIEQEYLPWAKVHRKSGAQAVARINRCFLKEFGSTPLSQLTPIVIEKWRSKRLNRGTKQQTLNIDIATLKAALSKAVTWGFISDHPLKKIELLKVDQVKKVRFLTQEEENRLRQALDEREALIKQQRASANQWRKERGYTEFPHLTDDTFADHVKPMVLLSINTGLRQGEMFTLAWENIDLATASITITGDLAKSGKTRHVPLNSEALAVLTTWHNQTEQTRGLVFPSKGGHPFNNVRKAWHGLLQRAGIKEFRWHDLRHHFASMLVMAGVDLNTVRELLGHSDIKMTLRYAHLAPEHKANAVEKLVRK
jgi:integrase